jgi:hypothetical protein
VDVSGLRDKVADAIAGAVSQDDRYLEHADAVLRVLAEHGDTQQVERRIVDIIEEQLGSQIDATFIGAQIMEAVVAPIVAARDAALERAEDFQRTMQDEMLWRDRSMDRADRAEGDLAAARQQLDQVWEGRDLEQQALRNAIEILTQIRELATGFDIEDTDLHGKVLAANILRILDAPARPAGHDEAGQP